MLRHPRNPARRYPVRPYWNGTGHRHEPGCLPGRSCRTGHRSDTRLLPSLSRVTPSAISEHCSELIGFPISRSFTTYCVCLELRSLPSTGITRLQRYYEPLRHPGRPACPSRASGWSSLTTPWGFPCCVRFPCVHAVANTPAQRLGVPLRSIRPRRVSLPRYGSRVGLCIVLFEACSAFTRVTACTLALSPYIVTR